MRKLLILLSLFFVFVGLTLGQADVTRSENFVTYLPLVDGNYVAVGASDYDLLLFRLNQWAGCGFEHNWPPSEGILVQDVATPSDNFLTSGHGPIIHVIWEFSDFPNWPFCEEPIAWGWGSISLSVQEKPNKGLSIHYTATGTLPDDSDWCEGELISFTGLFKSKAGGGQGMQKINLSCLKD